MERTERFYKIQNLLRSRHFVSMQDFMSELGISRATFKRDLEYLRDRMHAPIVYDRDQKAYGFGWFTVEELDDWIADRGPIVKREAEPKVERSDHDNAGMAL